jgi:hypothetical protein
VASGSALAAGTEVHVGLGVVDVQFFGENGERGGGTQRLLRGVVADVAQKVGRWRFSAEGRYFSGSLHYEAFDSDTRMQSLTLRVAREFQIGRWTLAPYVGYGDHEWRFGTSPSQIIDYWKTAEIGALVPLGNWGRFDAGLDVRAFRIVNPSSRWRRGSNGAPDLHFARDETSGNRIALIGGYRLEERWRLRLECYQERWAFGGSASQTEGDGNPLTTLSIRAGRYETVNTGVTLGLVVGF